MIRLVLPTPAGEQFWQVEVRGREVVTQWGATDVDQDQASEAFETPHKAKTHASLAVAAKVKDGYAHRPLDAMLKGVAVDPEAFSRTTSSAGDPTALRVFADSLTEQGHPWGELISVQLALGAAPETTELVVRERQLLSRVGLPDHDLTCRWG